MKSKFKAVLSFILIACMLTSFYACSSDKEDSESTDSDTTQAAELIGSEEDVTLENIIKLTTPKNIVDEKGTFSVKKSYEESDDAMLKGTVDTYIFGKNGDIYEISEKMVYADGYVTSYFYSTDPDDQKIYIASTGGNSVENQEKEFSEEFCGNSIAYYGSDTTTLTSVESDGDTYVATLSVDDVAKTTDTVVIDKSTGHVTSIKSVESAETSEHESTVTYSFDYSDGIMMDYSAKTENGGVIKETTTASTTEATTQTTTSKQGEVVFSSVDVYGNRITSDVMSGAKLVLLNFWEPWCGPCVGEMPDLQKLYEKYKDKGLVIVGVYSTESNAKDIVESNGITYPTVKCDSNLSKYEQDYVPATYLVDGNGNFIDDAPIRGSRSYSDWEQIILDNLK